jgi:hypothetical protein
MNYNYFPNLNEKLPTPLTDWNDVENLEGDNMERFLIDVMNVDMAESGYMWEHLIVGISKFLDDHPEHHSTVVDYVNGDHTCSRPRRR